MSIIKVNNEELFSIMQRINLVKLRFGRDDVWFIAPVLYVVEGGANILVGFGKEGCRYKMGEQVIIKFQRLGYEYLINGNVTDLDTSQPTSVTVEFTLAQKHYNMRKYTRFDTNLKVAIKASDGYNIDSLMRNISKGGAMIVANKDIDLDSIINLKINFNSGNCFVASTRVVRKVQLGGREFSYGLQFVGISGENCKIIDEEISKYERAYLKSLNILKEYSKKAGSSFDTKVAIMSHDVDESFEIKEALVKLGAENFDVFQSYKFYVDFYEEEKPKVVIIDAESINDEIAETISNVSADYPAIRVMLLLPIEKADKISECGTDLSKTHVLYKPLIYNEFEEMIIKYL